MSKAEKFIQLNTKTYSNETRVTIGRHSHWEKQPWITPEQALAAVEIAKKETIDKACEWLKCQDEMIGISFEEDFIERFKKYMEDSL